MLRASWAPVIKLFVQESASAWSLSGCPDLAVSQEGPILRQPLDQKYSHPPASREGF